VFILCVLKIRTLKLPTFFLGHGARHQRLLCPDLGTAAARAACCIPELVRLGAECCIVACLPSGMRVQVSRCTQHTFPFWTQSQALSAGSWPACLECAGAGQQRVEAQCSGSAHGGCQSQARHRQHPLHLTLGACGRPLELKLSAPQEGLCLPGGVSVRFVMRLWRRLCALGPASVLAGLALGVRTHGKCSGCSMKREEKAARSRRCSAAQGL